MRTTKLSFPYMLCLHLVCILVYALPIFVWKSPLDQGLAVLDEVHIVTPEHKDIYFEPPVSKYNTSTTATCGNNHSPSWQDSLDCWYQNMVGWTRVQLELIRNDQLWTNDYWGRPMSSHSSHKSWRPWTVLSFRYLRFSLGESDVDTHRLINVLLHALVSELVALLAVALVTPYRKYYQQPAQTHNPQSSSSSYAFWLYTWTKLLFVCHPTHVEVTANAANRPHLIAVAAACLVAHPQTPLILVFLPSLVIGFLSAETFLFAMVPATLTLLLIQYPQQERKRAQQNSSLPQRSAWSVLLSDTLATVGQSSLRIGTMFVISLLYYGGRHALDWLSIPTGLIRPAENPYYRLTGRDRFIHYAYVTALHIAKSWDLDWVGFSHEYGHECLRRFESWSDVRLLIPLSVLLILGVLPLVWFFLLGHAATCFPVIAATPSPTVQTQESSSSTPVATDSSSAAPTLPPVELQPPQQHSQVRPVWSLSFVLWLFHLSWLATLFPIMGIVKVGTFVADRIVVPSTVSVCILVAHFLASWLDVAEAGQPALTKSRRKRRHKPPAPFPLTTILGRFVSRHWRILFALFLWMGAWRRVWLRTWDWMDPLPLLQSSIRTCPQSAKSHLEVSKIYSGLYPDLYNLTQARWHLQQVERIDPTYCDVHFQYAHVALQQEDASLLELEERLTKALPCPYTMGAAMALWKQYWQVATAMSSSSNNLDMMQSIPERQADYQAHYAQAAAEREEEEQREHEEWSKSRTASWQWWNWVQVWTRGAT